MISQCPKCGTTFSGEICPNCNRMEMVPLCEICYRLEARYIPPNPEALDISHCNACWIKWLNSDMGRLLGEHCWNLNIAYYDNDFYVKGFQMWIEEQTRLKIRMKGEFDK